MGKTTQTIEHPKSNLLKNFLIGVAILVVYVLAGKLGLKLAFVNASATAVWPPTGIAIATMLIFGRRFWPVIFLGAFLVNITTAGTIATSLGIAFGNTLEGIIGSYLVGIFAAGRYAFDKAQNIFKFAILAGLVATAVSAIIGVTTLTLGGFADITHFKDIWLTWWLGDMAGALVVTPFIVLWSTKRKLNWQPGQTYEAITFVGALIVLGILIFTGVLPFAYLSIPIILWPAFRFGQREVVTATVILLGIAIWGTLHSQGPFMAATPNESLLFLQAFIAVISVTSLAVAAVVYENRRAEQILSEREERFRSLIENSSDAVALITATGKVEYISPSNKRIFGFDSSEVVGHNGFDFIYPGDRTLAAGKLAKLIAMEKGALTVLLRFKHKNGSWRWVELVATNLLKNPNVNAIVLNYRDITEAKNIDIAKTEFVSTASHQLRSPITMIKWYTEILLRDDLAKASPTIKHHAQELYNATQRLGHMVNALLDVSRIELGTFSIKPELVKIKDICDSIIESLKTKIVEKKLIVTVQGADKLPKIKADVGLLRIIFENLITNAITYTPAKGKVTIDISSGKYGDSQGLFIQFIDSGYGIPKADQPKIFTKLFRADNVRQKVPEGTGLGLYITKSIVDQAGGNISFTSQENRGTTFIVWFPTSGMAAKTGPKQLTSI